MSRTQVRAALSAAALGVLCGCTAIGWGLGSLADRGKPPKARPVAREELDTLEPGQDIELVLWDGRKLSGRYKGLTWAEPADYAARYEEARRRLAPAVELPALGPQARVALTSGRPGTGAYLGLGPGFVWFQETGAKSAGPVRLHRLATLADREGRSVSGERLLALLGERRVPTLVSLGIEQPGQDAVVPSEQVASVDRLVPDHGGRNAGLIIGVVADVAVVTAAAIAMSQPWGDSGGSTTTTSSCPLLDSFDGREFVLDAEPLGGAFYSAAERTDVVRLDHLVPADGEYRLRLRNDQWEIDHVDAIALRVVDHAPGTEVVPDASGRPLVVRSPVVPASARLIPTSAPDRRRLDLRPVLAAADGDAWVSDVWGRDPRREDHLRDGVEIEYPVPVGARTAVLVARVGATAFGPRVLQEVLRLHGRALGDLYAMLDSSAVARATFERARERDVLPTVRVLAGDGWRPAGVLRDLPSLVRRDQTVPIDLGGVEGGTLRIRIDGPPGLWALDRAVVAFDAAEAVHDVRISLARAEGERDGVDLTPLLRRADRRRHALRPRADTALLAFEAPPPRPGWSRTVLVEATGYYNVIVPAQGEPRPEAFRRLLDEPGAVARFALERLSARPPGAPPAGRARSLPE